MTPAEIITAGCHWVEYAGLLWFAGVVVLRRLGVMQAPELRWARPQMHWALAVALAGGLGLLLSSPSWLGAARVVAEGLALVLCLTIGAGAVPAGVLALFLLAPASHAAHVEPMVPALFVDELHVLSAAMWAGGVLALATVRPPAGWRSDEGRDLLTRFGRVAMVAFAFTAVTGLLRATEELTGLSDLWQTGYGVVLSAKSAGVVAMLAVAAITWRRGVPLARTDAALAIGVIAATGALAAFPIPPAGA